jgi:hypothetical protein
VVLVVTWIFVKRLHGLLEGIEVTETLTQDAKFGAPFKAGQYVRACAGSNYTVVSCERA